MASRTPRTLLVVAAAVSTVAATLTGAGPSVAASSKVTIKKVVTGLNAPRGIAFDGAGKLYVAESGVAGSGPQGLTNTGRVSKFNLTSAKRAWSTRFESLYASQDPSQPPDVLGPEGLAALGTGCASWDGKGSKKTWRQSCQVRLIMSESHDGVAAMSNGAVSTKQLGHLYRLNADTGAAKGLSNVGNQMYKWTGDRKSLFPDDFPDSNPFGVLIVRDTKKNKVRTFVADAGANTISEVKSDGTLRVVSYIPNETAPPFRDATPTCMAWGPDNKLYVATLHLVANIVVPGATGGKSQVWKVNPNNHYPQAPKVWAKGLTTATGCTFDTAGNFWAAEMFQPNKAGAPGDVVRIPFAHPGQLHRYGGGQLVLPGSIAQGPDGAMYVTTHSSDPKAGSGQVMRVRLGS